jgi:thiol-disulfide isomerase/thioredoxin
MTQITVQIGLRVLTFVGAASALLGSLWLGQLRAEPTAAREVVAPPLQASFDVSRVKLVVFAMQGCGHCKNFKKELASIHAAYPNLKIELVEYTPGQNDAKNRAAQARIGLAQVQGFPTTVVFVDGISTAKMPGYRPAADFLAYLAEQVAGYDKALAASM